MQYSHTPVMALEVIEYLNVMPGKIYVDCTLGGAGHARAVIERMKPGGFLIGLDQDQDAVEHARGLLAPHASDVALFHENFENLESVLSRLEIRRVDGILVDLGISFHQIAESGRGFTFRQDEPLDMRMDVKSTKTAAEIINRTREKELANIFWKYGEERWSKRIAKNIVQARKSGPIETTFSLVNIILDSIPGKELHKTRKIHPATRVFMALRIAVNQELEVIEKFIEPAADLLNPGGRLCILSFHSLEDRIVKHGIRALERGCSCPSSFPTCVCGFEPKLRSLTRKPVRPSPDEITANPMARSTRLRAAERI